MKIKNNCLHCKKLSFVPSRLAAARLVPSTKFWVRCTKYQNGELPNHYINTTYDIALQHNNNMRCFK